MTAITKAKPTFKRTGLRAKKPLVVELRGIRQFESMSDETNCYEATLYVDGKRVCRVSNRGQGGPDEADDWKAYREADERVKHHFPDWSIDGGVTNLETDLEIVCGEIVNDFLVWRDVSRAIQRKLVFTKKNDAALYYIKNPKDASLIPSWINKLALKPDTDKVLNLLPIEQAMQIWRTHQ